jgi:hypothetical protein
MDGVWENPASGSIPLVVENGLDMAVVVRFQINPRDLPLWENRIIFRLNLQEATLGKSILIFRESPSLWVGRAGLLFGNRQAD